MKARVIETGEIIEVKSLYSPTYSRLDCNGKIIEEYDADELEFEPGPKMVSLDKICEWIKDNMDLEHDYPVNAEEFIDDLRKEFE
jgi:hypothetical protein